MERLERPEKNWKFSSADLAERAFWDDYQRAFQDAIGATSTKWAPWYVIPADHKYISRALVACVLTNAIKSLGLKTPVVSKEKMKELEEAKRKLLRDEAG